MNGSKRDEARLASASGTAGRAEEPKQPLLKVEGGSFSYKGGPQILRDIELRLEPGEVLAVLGPNGAGKTTLLRCMMDMLRWDSGRSLLYGEDIKGMSASRLWRHMAYVPQARSSAASYTAFQTVLLGRSGRIGAFSAPRPEDMEAAERALKELGIWYLADKPCHSISGGELQMVLIARAAAAEAELLVLDEPESNLDFRNQLIVLDTVSELASKGTACVFNTHYPAHALQRADKALMLSRGGDALFGDTLSVVTEDNIRRAFGVEALIGEVETPYTVMKNVVPVGLARDNVQRGEKDGAVLASLTVITGSSDPAAGINSILTEYNHLVIGRMGLPHRSSGHYIITIMLEGSKHELDLLCHRLSLIPGISVKITYALD